MQKCQNINFWKLVPAGFHAILIYEPVETSFQVDIEIYKRQIGQIRRQDSLQSYNNIHCCLLCHKQFMTLT